MFVAQHLWELILFLIIFICPISLSFFVAFLNHQERINYSLFHFSLIFVTSWSIVQVSTGLILGSFDALNISGVILAELGIFILGCILNYPLINQIIQFLNPHQLFVNKTRNQWEWLIIFSVGFVGFLLLGNLATKPITNYDSLWFHLPAIARWYQTGSLTLLDATGNWIFEQEQARVYPYNWHILSVLCLFPFKSDFLVAFPMLIAWGIQGLSVYLLSVKFGATRVHGMGASALVLTVPMMLNQVNTIHPDLPLSAIFTLGLYLGLSYYKTRYLSELSLFLAATGMLAGIKITGLVYAVSLLIGLGILEIQRFVFNKNPRENPFKILYFFNPILLCGLVFLLLLGGFWYGRNLLHINHPIVDSKEIKFPLEPVTIPSTVKPPALPKQPDSPHFKIWQSTLAAQFNPSNIDHWETFGLQIMIRLQVPFIALVFQVLALPLALTTAKKKLINQNTIILSVLLASTGIMYLITPYSSGTAGESIGEISPLLGFNLRYGFPFLSVLGIAAAATATCLKTSNQFVVTVVVVSTILGITSNTIFDYIKNASFTGNSIVWGSLLIDSFKSNPLEALETIGKILASSWNDIFIYAILYLVSISVVAGILLKTNPRLGWQNNLFPSIFRHKLNYLVIIGICIGLIVIGNWREQRDVARTALYRGIYEYINENTVPNEKIGFFLSCRSYLFYGKNLNRQVLYVPLKADRISVWIDNLRQNQVSIIGFGPLTDTDAVTRKSLSKLTGAEGPLEPVFGRDFNTEPVLYRLKN
ncbi:MAG: hypothetical protein EAZ78_05725 [Oscillatoriales cyanobacterium]|uniref:Glycosyltransferase RgtA/B/C/D-like domain-containing protein n=1 Tax=Microcoleus anatoxicus PTRS2 TaxID=2705321 RepID=A0ABU8YL84_9CYAN|nr:MAG: hypothetical protein EA000_14885 [Oscillatoriales cyanobacterium]TAD96108.1 MAG: hypothetical protein EAZ98_13505 [Oscillatoriales cyanobacterium]TAE05114.1 MAG: hypothetical protein EAZ96_06510 [Oscillatoriales cyanobacterium]TAF05342.1 MAG: hypothetical protein EAZ78_05725 [Oscillatoriales cyanobacterium]TAF33994.1 MAG: hypothetical protein EAZ68_19535 [Oscillatoriales cyanobacterium]